MAIQLTLSLGLVFGSLVAGWALHRRGWFTERQAARLVRWISMGPSALTLALLFWNLDLHRAQPWLLTALGLITALSTLLPAWWYARAARLPPAQTGSFLTCAMFSNVGYVGAFIAFALFGEVGYGLCQLFFLSFGPLFYTVGFGVALHHGHAETEHGQGAAYRGELRWYPYAGMAVGLVLNLLGIPRPLPMEWLNHGLIPFNTAVYLVAVGSQLRFHSPWPWLRPCLAMSAIKFLYTPAVAWLLVSLMDLHGMPRTVVLLEAATPVAVSPLVLPMLFGLDRKLTSALWLVTTALSLPFLAFYLPLIR
ncbi:MAG: AEC family transporter [Candidatus Omnitrophica bacterium]|nr:AEC family transporter [Candidatus Omnitrophota bacterium]